MAPPKRQRRSQALDNLGAPADGYVLTGETDAEEGMAWVAPASSTGTVSIDPPSIDPTSRAAVTATVTGVAVGDTVVMSPPADLDDDLVFAGATVTDADEVTVYLYNPTGGAVNDTARTWRWLWMDMT